MSLVREVSLLSIDGSWRLVQQAAGDFTPHDQQRPAFSLSGVEITDGQHVLEGASGTVQRFELTIEPGTAEEFGIVVRGDGSQGTRIGVRPAEGTIFVDRRESGQTNFHESFASIETAPILTADGSYEIEVYVDHCSVEVFAQGGQVTLTDLIFPAATSTAVSVYAIGGTARLNDLTVTQYA
ncbi:GH32 C-terminal domain-containing protein [Arthrobacter sp. SD76]|uniref:GH32 C-terminal domain-containing protein n=1 Tax=Arthrobacter sp. SD76 TaxID=3415007 RepID=UPI003C733CBA